MPLVFKAILEDIVRFSKTFFLKKFQAILSVVPFSKVLTRDLTCFRMLTKDTTKMKWVKFRQGFSKNFLT